MTLELDKNGHLYIPSQFTDYLCRGNALELFNVFQFFADTWEADHSAPKGKGRDIETEGDQAADTKEHNLVRAFYFQKVNRG